jgi:hypothetical protein
VALPGRRRTDSGVSLVTGIKPKDVCPSAALVAVDFTVVPTVTGQLLVAFVVLSLARRRVLHVDVTAQPTAVWTAQQMAEALPWASTAR